MSDKLSLEKLFNLKDIDIIDWDFLNYMQHDIDIIICAQREILKRFEDYILEMRKKYNNKIDLDSNISKKPKNIQEEMDNESYKDHFYGEEGYVINEIIQSNRKAFVISMFSIIENKLKEICEFIELISPLEKSKEIKGEINKCYNFFTKELKIDENLVKELYEKINKRKFVRNKIVHNNSMVQRTRPQPGLTFCKSYNGYKIKISDAIYLEDFLDDTYNFFEAIIKAIDMRYLEEKTVWKIYYQNLKSTI